MWKLIQIATFLAVAFSSIYYGWGSDVSGLAVSVVGIAAAFVVTAIPFSLLDLWQRWRARMNRNAKRPRISLL